jgi:hypothetical protein
MRRNREPSKNIVDLRNDPPRKKWNQVFKSMGEQVLYKLQTRRRQTRQAANPSMGNELGMKKIKVK